MERIQFQATIKDGKIEIPRQYWKKFQDQVRVILVAGEINTSEPGLIDSLLANPVKMKGFRPLKRDDTHAR